MCFFPTLGFAGRWRRRPGDGVPGGAARPGDHLQGPSAVRARAERQPAERSLFDRGGQPGIEGWLQGAGGCLGQGPVQGPGEVPVGPGSQWIHEAAEPVKHLIYAAI